jgi:hypothetical protein
LGGRRHEKHEFKTFLDYMARPYLKTNKQHTMTTTKTNKQKPNQNQQQKVVGILG